MRYIKEILKKNLLVTSGYLVIGVFNSFLLNYKADYFQKIIDGLSGGTLTIELYLQMQKGQYDNAFGIGCVLIVIVLILNLLTKLAANKLRRE